MNTDAKTVNRGVHEGRIVILLIPKLIELKNPKVEDWGWVWETRGIRVVSLFLYKVLSENQRLGYDQVTHVRR